MGQPVLAIVGPTAIGKSALALRLAQQLGGEIVSADSRQVYRFMDIGTAKPAPEEFSAVPHHLIDVVDPDQPFSLAMFLERARAAIAGIAARSRLPIVVGGTGQWVWALLEGWDVPPVAPDTELRAALEERARLEGHQALYEDLSRADPAAAARIDSRNVRRVIRALEIAAVQDTSPPATPHKTPPSFDTKLLGLTLDRSKLYRRIDDRVDSMIDRGWVGEVTGLLERGYGPELPSMSGLGYRELVEHLRGELDLDTAVERIKYGTHRFARSQYRWFRHSDPRIRWFDSDTGLNDAAGDIAAWLRR
jgi:tRNA dimethylallyltransferase